MGRGRGLGRGPEGDFEGPGAREWLERYDPEMYELEKRDRDLERETAEKSHQMRNVPSERRDEVRAEFRKLIDEHFEVRQKRRTLQLSRLESEMKRMRESIEKRKEAKAQIIDRRVSEMLGEKEELGF